MSPRVVWASGTDGTVIRTEDGGATWTRSTIPERRQARLPRHRCGQRAHRLRAQHRRRRCLADLQDHRRRTHLDAAVQECGQAGVLRRDGLPRLASRLRVQRQRRRPPGHPRDDDGGAHWSRIGEGLPPALENEGAFAASGTNIAIDGDRIWIATSRSRVILSADNGRSWSAVSTPVPAGPSAGLFSIAFASRDRGIVVGGDYKAEAAAADNAAVTGDGGRTWTVVKGLGGFRSAVGYVAAGPAPLQA